MLPMAIASAALGAAAGLRRKKGGRLPSHAVYGQRRQGRRQKGGIIPLLALAAPAIAAAAKQLHWEPLAQLLAWVLKRLWVNDSPIKKAMSSMRRQLPFLQSLLHQSRAN